MKLIKRKEGYYVPWSYEFWTGRDCTTGAEMDLGIKKKPQRKDETSDNCACPPIISFCKIVGKWKLSFDSADGGGYDVQRFDYYFDCEQDIIDFMDKQYWHSIRNKKTLGKKS